MYQLKQNIITEQVYYERLLREMQKELAESPKGSYGKRKVNGKDFYYHQFCDNNKIVRKGISKQSGSNQCLLKSLKRKHFLQKSIQNIENALKALSKFRNNFDEYNRMEICEKLSISYEEIAIKRINELIDVEMLDWDCEEFEQSNLFPENLRHISMNGTKVRSKSELLIADKLDFLNIPYRYEAALLIGDTKYYPDFTIFSPTEKKIIFWEHFGLTNEDDYLRSMYKKLIVYRDKGITTWDNLITTYDSNNGEINSRTIQRIIDVFLLCRKYR